MKLKIFAAGITAFLVNAKPYTMLVCEEANNCKATCSNKDPKFNYFNRGCHATKGTHRWQWSLCRTKNDKCNASKIQCNSLKYKTVDDIIENYGEREPATEHERKGM